MKSRFSFRPVVLLSAAIMTISFHDSPWMAVTAFMSTPAVVRRFALRTTSNEPRASNALLYSSKAKTEEKKLRNVVFQKVVRPPKGLDHLLFLGHLVDYLSNVYTLPTNLPMIYEKVSVDEPSIGDGDDYNGDGRSGADHVVSFDSPLSFSSAETRLAVEVVGLFKNKEERVPSMAMVVLTKANVSPVGQGVVAPMMKDMFANSEKRIFKSLERGLDDVSKGKVPLSSNSWKRSLDSDLMDPKNKPKTHADKEEKSSSSISDSQSQEYAIKAAKKANTKREEEANRRKELAKSGGGDFAVEAAKKLKKEQSPPSPRQEYHVGGGYANDAARIIAEKKKRKAAHNPEVISSPSNSSKRHIKSPEPIINAEITSGTDDPPKQDSASNSVVEIPSPNVANAEGRPRNGTNEKATSALKSDKPKIGAKPREKRDSNRVKAQPQQEHPSAKLGEDLKANEPKDTASSTAPTDGKKERASQPSDSKKTDGPDLSLLNIRTIGGPDEMDLPEAPPSPPLRREQKKKKARTLPKVNKKAPTPAASEEQLPSTSKQEMTESNRLKLDGIDAPEYLNLRVIDDPDEAKRLDASWGGIKIANPEDPSYLRGLEDDAAIKQGSKMLEQFPDEDFTPEELLDRVMKFANETKKEEERGFANGAFEMAKHLLRENTKKRKEKLQTKEVTKDAETISITSDLEETFDDYDDDDDEQVELKKMFEAGERMAENMIRSPPSDRKVEEENQKKVDKLLEAEKSVSSYARTVDDELAELEIRINPTPGEELDGPMKYPIFDVMAGPEVYNPNVDAETTVNWPGAKPGTKKVRLPKQLQAAVQNAKFAASVLENLQEQGKDVLFGRKDGKENDDKDVKYVCRGKELSQKQVDDLLKVVNEAVKIGLIEDPVKLMQERARLRIIIRELYDQPEERFLPIAEHYKDLLLSDNFVGLVKATLKTMARKDFEAFKRGEYDKEAEMQKRHLREREILSQLVNYAQVLLKEAREVGAQLEVTQLELIRSICRVAMDPKHTTEEETSLALTDAVRDMRPLFDDYFVAYIKYAVAEEEGRLARAGLLDDPEHNRWWYILKIVQQGVYKEIAVGINSLIEHVWYVLRMETPAERRTLLASLIDDMPTMDIRPFVKVVDNIVCSLGEAVRGDIDPWVIGEMTNKLLQLHRDVHELLPPDRINIRARDADEWAQKQKEKIEERMKLTRQRLRASEEFDHVDPDKPRSHRRSEQFSMF